MDLEVGSILEGKVTGITKFGAFILLPGGVSGLVHISEIANSFVNDVNDYLTVGETVKVKVIGINDAGKINLSIKQLQPPEPKPQTSPRRSTAPAAAPRQSATRPQSGVPPVAGELHGPSDDVSFEDKLKHFMQESDKNMSGNKLYAERSSRRRRK